jgi:succinate dehydrogenase/fumarate reductase cytochrome b subunit
VAEQPRPTAKGIARLHAALGVLLGGYLVFHVWQQWPVVISTDAWLDRARHAALPTAGKLALAAVVIAHVVLGALRLRLGPHPADDSAAAGMRRLQLFFGVLVLVFLAVHLPLVRWTPGPASTVLDVHARLTAQLGTPALLVVHLVGLAAACAHLALGLGRAAVTFGLVRDPRALYVIGAVLATVLFFQGLQVLAQLAIGEPLLPFWIGPAAP